MDQERYAQTAGNVWRLAFAGIAAILMVLIASPAWAATYGTDFENPPFTPGSPNGQDGWSRTGNFDHEIEDVSGETGAPDDFGAQSFRISNATTAGSFGDQTFSKSLADEAGETSAENGGQSGGERQNHFEASFDFTSTEATEQEGLLTVVSPDRGDGARMSWVELSDKAGGLMVRFSDYQRGADESQEGADLCDEQGCFVRTTVAENLDRSGVYTVEIVMDFVDGNGNDIVTATVRDASGSEIGSHTGTSWEDYFRDRENNPTRTVDSLLFRTAGIAAPATEGNGFFIDNLSLQSSVVERPLVVDEDGKGDVDESGNVDCDANVAAFSSIQAAENAAAPGDTVYVCPGTFEENVAVDVADLTFEGAQAGNDARDRTGDESIVQSDASNNAIFNIAANGVTLDGFTVQGTGAGTDIVGVSAPGSVSGYEIVNNIVQDTTFGIYANGTDGLIENNLLQNNNREGAAGGSGIYADQGSNSITVNENEFADHENTSILFTAVPPTRNSDLSITNNDITGNRIFLSYTDDSVVSGNTITDSLFSGVQVAGGNDGITVEANTITGSGQTEGDDFPFPAVRVTDSVGGGANAGTEIIGNTLVNNDAGVSVRDSGVVAGAVEIHQNRIFGNGTGIDNGDEADDNADVDAENNWWGCNEGPNEGGCDTTEGVVDSRPWIVMDISSGRDTIGRGGSTRITVTFLLDRGNGEVARDFPDGTRIAFDAERGQVDPRADRTENGKAGTTLTSNTRENNTRARAELDAERVNTKVRVIPRR